MKFLLWTLVISFGVFVKCREQCYPRDYGKGSIVCVCNVTHCDDLEPIKKTPKGVVTVFTTSKAGHRFKETHLKFGYRHSETTKTSEKITIDKSKKVQTIIGFGGSFTDATGYMIGLLPQSMRDRIIRDFFSDRGLEYNLNRLPIGGADFSLRAYSYDDNHPDDFNLDHFALQQEDHEYKIPYMKKAKKVSPHPQKFFGSPWSAPAWMKNNSELNHGGWLKGNPGEQYYKTFAKYFVKFLDAYKKEGLDMWGITIENEPQAGKNPKYSFNSMGFIKEIQRDFIKKDLGPTLLAAGYGKDKLNVMIFDDQRFEIHEWAKTIFGDKEAADYVTGIAYHWYDNKPANLVNLDKTHDIDPTKFIVNTEASNAEAHDAQLGYWHNCEAFVKDMVTVLNHYVNGYVHWNMVLDVNGGPNWAQLTADAPIISNPLANEYYKQPSFYGLGHVMKFISPGSVRLAHTQTLNSDKLLSTVFQRPDGGIVVVVVNLFDDMIEYNISESDQHLSNAIEGHSVQTYLFYD